MARVELDRLTKVFRDDDGDVVAVDDVSLDVADGEFLVLVGPSGCGKSTTLRMIAGLDSITSGEIRVDGQRVNERRPQERDVAMVFQSYALYPHMTVRENMAFGLGQSTDLSDREIDERVREAAETMEITDLLGRKPRDLSGGQRQRVALGRAIVRDPEVFLMDEPLANLDARLRSQMRTELQRLQDDLGVTTIYVTHDQTEAMTMGDRIAILDAGRLQQVAPPLEAYHRPANTFVAGFLGEPSMNFFDVTVEGDRLAGEGFAFPLAEGMADALAHRERAVLGIRPEDVAVGGDPDDPHSYATTVDVVEPVGDEFNVYLTLDDVEDRSVFTAAVGGTTAIAEGDRVVTRFPPAAVHLFDAETTEAVWNREAIDATTVEPRGPE